jgi:hypothetical protein
MVSPSLRQIALGMTPDFFRSASFFGRPQLHSSSARFGQPDGNRLFRRSRSVLSFAHVVNLFTHKFSRLG